jgi:hypothetical protein
VPAGRSWAVDDRFGALSLCQIGAAGVPSREEAQAWPHVRA